MPFEAVGGAILGAVASNLVGKAMGGSGSSSNGGGGGGSGGGNAPPVYQMSNSPGMDTAFQDSYTDYRNMVNQNWWLTDPMTKTLLQNQMNNPYAQEMLNAGRNAGWASGAGAVRGDTGANNLQQNTNDLYSAQQGIQNKYMQQSGAMQQNVDQLREMAGGSNSFYNNLINQQKGQLQNINNASDGLYGAGGNALRTTNQLTNFLEGQQGNIQQAMTHGYKSGSDAYNTTNNLVGMQENQAGNVYGQADNLYGAANQLQNDAFDPQKALYDKNVGQLQENIRAGEYARGIQMSPAGASIEADALENFQNTWQNQQLAREAQGINAASGAAQSAQGMTNSYGNNIVGLQGQGYATGQGQFTGAQGIADSYAQNVAGVQGRGYGTAAGADQSAQGMQNSYSNAMSNLNDSMNSQYANLSGAANNLFTNFMNNQTNNAAAGNSAIAQGYGNGANLSGSIANLNNQAGQYPYANYLQNTNAQNTALQNYNTNMQPYMTGLVQNQNSALGYINRAAGLQNQGYLQNMSNQNAYQNTMGNLGGVFGQVGNGLASAAGNAWNKYVTNGYNGSGTYVDWSQPNDTGVMNGSGLGF